jgi:cbb3-type cytochrome oxidase subunit 3
MRPRVANRVRLAPFAGKPRRVTFGRPRAVGLDWNTLNTEAYFIGKGVILFTMFYCGLNWAMYRNARKREENEKDNDKRD